MVAPLRSVSETTRQQPTLTPSQGEVVLADGTHLLVSAGAGSGKTTTVVEKLCYLLGADVVIDGRTVRRDAPMKLDAIGAITYTVQAAADLQRKLRRRLRGAGMRQIAAEVDGARIGTIHGFCMELLQEFALRAGLPASYEVAGEAQSWSLTRDAALEAITNAADAGSLPELAATLTDRRINDVVDTVARLAEDADRLRIWTASRDELRPHEKGVLQLAIDTVEIRTRLLRERGAIDFAQMVIATRDLLRDNAVVRHAVQRRVRLLVIDEFQDVDPPQADIAKLLGGLTYDDPQPTQLVLVGDPKQSIYRFRHADVALWKAISKEFERTRRGRILELRDNFRSKEAILRFADDVVGSAFAASSGSEELQVDYASLDARRDDRDGNQYVEVLCVPATADNKVPHSGAVRAHEAAAMAARIRQLESQGHRYSEMAVLLGSWSNVDVYEQALRDAGIPSYSLQTKGFWQEREIIDCLLALRAIRDVGDDVAMIGFLKSPFIGMRDETLMVLSQRRHPRGLLGALEEPGAEQALRDRASLLLKRFSQLRDRIPIDELLRRLLWDSGFVAACALQPGRGKQAVANLRKLLRIAAESSEQSVGEFLREVEVARTSREDVAPERVYGASANVVTITSIHSAKGLEWPIVFWADAVREVSMWPDKLVMGRRSFRWQDTLFDRAKDDQVLVQFTNEVAVEHDAEQVRLWYVAATRAKDRLVITGVPCGTQSRQARSFASTMRERFPNLAVVEHGDSVFEYGSDDNPNHLIASLTEEFAPPRELPVEVPELALPPSAVIAPTGRRRLSATQLMVFARSPQQWWQQYLLGARPLELLAALRSDKPSAAAIGSLVHTMLEHYGVDVFDLDELLDPDSGYVDGDDLELLTDPGIRTQVRTLTEKAASHPAWQSLATRPTARRELSFTQLLADGSVLQGAFDLVALVDELAQVLDVKAGAARSAKSLEKRYAVQAQVYAAVASALTGRPSAVIMLGVQRGIAVEMRTRDAERDVGELIRRLRSPDYPDLFGQH